MAGEPIFILRSKQDDLLTELDMTRDPTVLVNLVFFNLWNRKNFPYSDLAEGDTLYWVDRSRRLIAAELRVTAIGRQQYNNTADAYRYLEQVFGVDRGPDGSRTYDPDNEKGYMMAVAVDPIAHLGISFDINWSKVGGRGGWVRLSTVQGSEHVSQKMKRILEEKLPKEGRAPAVRSYTVDTGAHLDETDMSRAPRTPAVAVVRELRKRAKGRCEITGCRGRAEHLDHKYPWSRGGNSDLVNLRWLCAKHNLEKSDRIPDQFSPDQVWIHFESELPDAAHTLGSDLEAMEVRTRNSVYDVVVDGDVVLCWKRASRTVNVAPVMADGQLIRRSGDAGSEYLVIGDPDGPDGPLYKTSRVVSVNNEVDPAGVLARIGKSPGQTLRFR